MSSYLSVPPISLANGREGRKQGLIESKYELFILLLLNIRRLYKRIYVFFQHVTNKKCLSQVIFVKGAPFK